MGLKLVKGSTFDVNLNPSDLEINKRGDLGLKFLNLKLTELRRFTVFWVYFACTGCLVLLSLGVSKLFILPLGVMAYFTIRQHFRYLQAWSTWNKFARRHVARIDMAEEQAIYGQPLMPWVNIPVPGEKPKAKPAKASKKAKK